MRAVLPVSVNDRQYAATTDALIEIIEDLDDKLECVLLVGHNPEFTDLARHFDSGITSVPDACK